MSKGFFDIFREAFGSKDEEVSPETKDSEGYTTLELETETEAQALGVYIVMNEGALRERDRIVAELNEIDANWVTYALEAINKIPRNLPRE